MGGWVGGCGEGGGGFDFFGAFLDDDAFFGFGFAGAGAWLGLAGGDFESACAVAAPGFAFARLGGLGIGVFPFVVGIEI